MGICGAGVCDYHDGLKRHRLHSHAGVEACRSLNELSLRGNSVSSMAPLAALTALRSLDLTGNRIAAVEGLHAASSALSAWLMHQASLTCPTKVGLHHCPASSAVPSAKRRHVAPQACSR